MTRWTRRSSATSRSVLAVLVAGGVALVGCAAGQQAQTAEQRPTVDGANVSVGPIALRDVALEYPAGGLYQQGGDARLQMVLVNQSLDSDALVEVRTDAAQEVTLTAAAPGSSVTPEPTGTSIGPSSTPTGTSSGTPTGTNEPATPSASAGSGEPSSSPLPSATSSESPAPSPSSSASTSAGPTGKPTGRIAIPANGLVSFRDNGARITLTGLTRQLRPAQIIRVIMVFQNAGRAEFDIPVSVPRGEISPAPTVTSVQSGGNEG